MGFQTGLNRTKWAVRTAVEMPLGPHWIALDLTGHAHRVIQQVRMREVFRVSTAHLRTHTAIFTANAPIGVGRVRRTATPDCTRPITRSVCKYFQRGLVDNLTM